MRCCFLAEVDRVIVVELSVGLRWIGSFSSEVKSVRENRSLSTLELGPLALRSCTLLSRLRSILASSDPVSYLRNFLDLQQEKHVTPPLALEIGSPASLESEGCYKTDDLRINVAPKVVGSNANVLSDEHRNSSVNAVEIMEVDNFTLPELFHPVKTLLRVFIGTFPCDVTWFLSCCRLPNHLPITIACHNSVRCWSAAPYINYPYLLLVYTPFPDVISFGKDRKKKGVACHHLKIIVLQRDESLRVIVTSADLVPKQWDYLTNTVWWQDVPRRTTPDYSAFFGSIEDLKSGFAAQLAGFVASLIVDVPSQAHWVNELAKYDFGQAAYHLVASLPEVHTETLIILRLIFIIYISYQVFKGNMTPAPYINYPNLLLVYPTFPDVIAFGKDRKKKGVACHHPKLIVLQTDESLRVPKQINIALFFCMSIIHLSQFVFIDNSVLYFLLDDCGTIFAAQLAGSMASLIVDVPSQVRTGLMSRLNMASIIYISYQAKQIMHAM
ncbi:hypothetical protein OPV22_022439 [Ensete ventricosum]|uniref:PLD phosphodiesterase domain-containing protein n=1 Tax=Ensete ventricosum TaxID=4639 RepID=A0AAV8QQT2_ENSVE|nr:hypothetical protein OPV22_022439 [Ensete ventricosum]